MAIDHTSDIPLYRQIIEDIKRQIGAGYLHPGDQIASNAELAKNYKVSLITVKNALADLIKDGYIYGRVGRGTFVADPNQFVTPASAGTLGFVLTDFNNPFFTGVLHYIEARVIDFGYRLLVSYSSNSSVKEEDQINHFQQLGVKGLIIASTEHTNQVSERILELQKSHFPYVLVSYVENTAIHYVGTDHEQGAYLATECLIQSGCKDIAYLNVEQNNPLGKLRRKGYLKALKSYQIAHKHEYEFHFPGPRDDFSSGYELGKQFLSLNSRPDGVFAFNDHSALGFQHAITEGGLKIPDDVRIVGFDDAEFDMPPPVPLTTIRQPADEIGLQAILMLNHQIEGHEITPRKILKPKLVRRCSC